MHHVYPEMAALSVTPSASGMCVAALRVSMCTKADAVSNYSTIVQRRLNIFLFWGMSICIHVCIMSILVVVFSNLTYQFNKFLH